MDRDDSFRRLDVLLSREYNSVEGYILNSSPFATDADGPALEAIQAIAAKRRATASWITERLREDFGAGPTLRAFEFWKTDLNYLSVPYLVRFALEHNRRLAAEYDGLLKEVAGDAPMETVVKRLRDEVRAHATALEKVAPATPA